MKKRQRSYPPKILDVDPFEGVRAVHDERFGVGEFRYYTNPYLTSRAKKMAKKMTRAESYLWFKVLSSKQTGFKWIKQKTVGHYILDFYCHTLSLGLEVDGKSHLGREAYDLARTKYLESQGIKIIRYKNEKVYNRLSWVKENLESNI